MAKNTYYVEIEVTGTKVFAIEADDEADLWEKVRNDDLEYDHTEWDDFSDLNINTAQIVGANGPDGKEL